MTVYWDAAATLVGSTNNAVGTTPEFNGATLVNPVAGNGTDTWVVAHDTGTDFLKMFGGISKLYVTSGQVRYAYASPNNVATDRERRLVMENRGPYLIAAYYYDAGTASLTDDGIWAIFNEPVDPTTIDGAFDGGATNFEAINGGGAAWAPTGGSAQLAFPGFTTASVILQGFTEPGDNVPGRPDRPSASPGRESRGRLSAGHLWSRHGRPDPRGTGNRPCCLRRRPECRRPDRRPGHRLDQQPDREPR